MRSIATAVLALALTGCAPSPPALDHAAAQNVLAQADSLLEQGEYAAAVQAYDEALARHPGDRDASRARASRNTVARLIAARADAARLRDALAARDGELTRLRQEVQRLTQETDRLRTDLETLKEIDLRQGRRRK